MSNDTATDPKKTLIHITVPRGTGTVNKKSSSEAVDQEVY